MPDPAAIFGTNLVLWLDASEPSTIVLDPDARIGEWKDRSTFANHAKMLYSGTGSVNVVSNAVNQHPALKFSGDPANTGMFEVEDVTSLQLGTNDFMIVAVAAYSNTPGYDEFGGRATLISKAADSYPYYGFALAGNAYNAPLADGGLGGPDSILFGGIKSFVDGKNAGAWSSNRGLNDSRFRAFAVRKDSANQAVYVHANGVATSSVADIDTAQSLSAFGGKVMIAGQKLAGQSSIGSPIKGYLAEIFLVRGTSGTTLERQQLAAYLQAKYALPF